MFGSSNPKRKYAAYDIRKLFEGMSPKNSGADYSSVKDTFGKGVSGLEFSNPGRGLTAGRGQKKIDTANEGYWRLYPKSGREASRIAEGDDEKPFSGARKISHANRGLNQVVKTLVNKKNTKTTGIGRSSYKTGRSFKKSFK